MPTNKAAKNMLFSAIRAVVTAKLHKSMLKIRTSGARTKRKHALI